MVRKIPIKNVLKIGALLFSLLIAGCATLAKGTMNELSNDVYFNKEVKKKDVQGKRVLIVPLFEEGVDIGETKGAGNFANKNYDDKKTFDANGKLLASTQAWTESFNAYYLPFALKNIANVQPSLLSKDSAAAFMDADFHMKFQAKGPTSGYRILTPAALAARGLNPDFGLFVTRIYIEPEEKSISPYGNYVRYREVGLTFKFVFAFWDYANDRMVACGSFTDQFDQSSLAPITEIMAKKYALKVFRLSQYLEKEAPKPVSSGMY